MFNFLYNNLLIKRLLRIPIKNRIIKLLAKHLKEDVKYLIRHGFKIIKYRLERNRCCCRPVFEKHQDYFSSADILI